MARKALTTYSLTNLKMEAGEKNIKWVSLAMEFGAKFHFIPGNFNTLMQAILTDLKVTRYYWEAKLSGLLSVKVAEKIAIDDYSSSTKVDKLLLGQVVLHCEGIALADDSLGYDQIRHNYSWVGKLFEIGDSFDKINGIRFCVIHPDENYEPKHELGVAYVTRSCTQKNIYGN